jgi:disulfide bond formation protein DsbB
MYPQVFLLAYAIWKKDRGIAPYILILCVIGFLIAAWHYGEQVQLALNPLDPDLAKPCDQTGVSCARTPIFEFGYITIPMMALTAFLLNALGSMFVLRSNRSQV